MNVINEIKRKLKKELKDYSFEINYLEHSYAKDGKTFQLVVYIPTPYWNNPTSFIFCHSNTNKNKIVMIYKTGINGYHFDFTPKTMDELITIEGIKFTIDELVNHFSDRVKEWNNWFK